METQGDDDQGFGSLTPKRKKTDEEENQRKNSKLESPANPSSSLKRVTTDLTAFDSDEDTDEEGTFRANRRLVVFPTGEENRCLETLVSMGEENPCLKRKADNPEEKSAKNPKKTKKMADRAASVGAEQDFKEALRQSRVTDRANSDHLAMRDHVVQGARQDGADEKEVNRIATARNWAKREDFSSIRKILSIGFNVYFPDRSGGIEWRFSAPSAETKGELVMMDLLYVDHVHYDLIIFGDLSDEKLQGFVLFCCYFNPQVLFFRLTREQQDKMVRGIVDGRAFVIVGYSGNC